MPQNSLQAARKSHKLDSLPEDLRGEADKLISNKFPPPKEEAKKKSADDNVFHGSYDTGDVFQHEGSGRPIQFAYTESNPFSLGYNPENFGATATVTHSTTAQHSIIDDSRHRIEGLRGIPPDYKVMLKFRVDPIGTFNCPHGSDQHTFMQKLRNEHFEVDILGSQLQYVRKYIEERVHALEKLYGGYFRVTLENYQYQANDMYGMGANYIGGQYGYR